MAETHLTNRNGVHLLGYALRYGCTSTRNKYGVPGDAAGRMDVVVPEPARIQPDAGAQVLPLVLPWTRYPWPETDCHASRQVPFASGLMLVMWNCESADV